MYRESSPYARARRLLRVIGGPFDRCPGVGECYSLGSSRSNEFSHPIFFDLIRQVLKNLRSSGWVKCLGQGQSAEWQRAAKWK